MFDYLRNCSSNAHQVCCANSLTKCLYNLSFSLTLALHSRSQLRLKRAKCITCTIIAISRKYLSCGIHTWLDSRLVHGICAHARVDDLDLDARSQRVGKGKTPALNYLDN